jgi:hypothetical protein
MLLEGLTMLDIYRIVEFREPLLRSQMGKVQGEPVPVYQQGSCTLLEVY